MLAYGAEACRPPTWRPAPPPPPPPPPLPAWWPAPPPPPPPLPSPPGDRLPWCQLRRQPGRRRADSCRQKWSEFNRAAGSGQKLGLNPGERLLPIAAIKLEGQRAQTCESDPGPGQSAGWDAVQSVVDKTPRPASRLCVEDAKKLAGLNVDA